MRRPDRDRPELGEALPQEVFVDWRRLFHPGMLPRSISEMLRRHGQALRLATRQSDADPSSRDGVCRTEKDGKGQHCWTSISRQRDTLAERRKRVRMSGNVWSRHGSGTYLPGQALGPPGLRLRRQERRTGFPRRYRGVPPILPSYGHSLDKTAGSVGGWAT